MLRSYTRGFEVLGDEVVTIPSVSPPKGYTDAVTVTIVQQVLKDRGYGSYLGRTGPNHDGVDGVMGPSTASAINALQHASGAPQTGVIDYGVLKLLGVSSPAQKTRTVVDATQMAIDQANAADTPAAVQVAADSLDVAALAASPPPPPEVRAQVARAKAAAKAATTPAQVDAAAAQVKDASKAVLATTTTFWQRTSWWEIGLVGVGVGAIGGGVYLAVRR